MAGYAVVNVESTGFCPERGDRLIELAIVQLDPYGEVEQAWDTLIDPERDVEPAVLRALGVGDLLGAPTFAAVAGRVAVSLSGRVFCAHNAGIDRRFLLAEFARASWSVPLTSRHTLCTMAAARVEWPGSPSRLGALCAQRGVPLTGPHTALRDALATAGIVRQLLETALASPRARRTGRLPWAAQLEAAALARWPTNRVAHPALPGPRRVGTGVGR
jgi:DNA polymerase-3 subunit epsilon